MSQQLQQKFKATCPAKATFASLRYVEETTEVIGVRRGVLEPIDKTIDRGVMVTVFADGGMGYAATADLSERGIRRAFDKAMAWAERSQGKMVFDPSSLDMPHSKGSYASSVERPWSEVSFGEKLDLLKHIDSQLPIDDRIIDWSNFIDECSNRITLPDQ